MEIINNFRNKINPTAGDVYGYAWNLMWKIFVSLLVITIIGSIISGPISIMNAEDSDWNWFFIPVAFFGILYGVFVAGPIGYSTSWVFLKASREEPFELKDMFAVFQRNYWNAVAANILVAVIVGFGIVLFIVPGIIFAIRLAFVPFLVIDREMEVSEALSKSWEMTKGYGGQIFLMGIIAFFVVILGLMALFVGVIISMMWIQLAFATMYQAVVEKEGHFGVTEVIEE